MGGFGNIGRAFASRNYRIYVTGNSISLTGTWLQRLAIGWLAWQLTHSGTWLGLVSFADLFPTVVLSPWAGALADRAERVRVIWVSQCIATTQAITLALLTYFDAIGIVGLFTLAAMMGIANAINQPARLALIPELVDRANLPSAVAINSIVFNGARFIGPMIAGIVIAARRDRAGIRPQRRELCRLRRRAGAARSAAGERRSAERKCSAPWSKAISTLRAIPGSARC